MRQVANRGSPWLIRYRHYNDAALRFFCFRCAGTSATEFRIWPARWPEKIELVGD
jgi:surfactin synthase thioesterase subunit